jgi:hypothetical protein
MRPYANAVREVLPPDRSRGIHQKLGGARDIVAVRASARMKDAIPADHFSLRIGKKLERVTPAGTQLARVLVGIDADSGDLDTTRAELAQAPFETP